MNSNYKNHHQRFIRIFICFVSYKNTKNPNLSLQVLLCSQEKPWTRVSRFQRLLTKQFQPVWLTINLWKRKLLYDETFSFSWKFKNIKLWGPKSPRKLKILLRVSLIKWAKGYFKVRQWTTSCRASHFHQLKHKNVRVSLLFHNIKVLSKFVNLQAIEELISN